MKNRITIASLVIAILLIISVSIGTSYSIWATSVNQVSVNTIDVGCFKITFNDRNITGAGDISLLNSYPMKNEAGRTLVPYKFNIENQCSVAASYNVNLETLTSTTMDESKLNVYFNDSVIKSYVPNIVNGLSDDAKNGMNLIRGYLPAGENVTYSLRVWIDYGVTVDTPNIQGKTWNGRIAVNSEATLSKPTFTNKVIGESNVTLDIDTRSSKTVSTLTCYYGDKNTQETRGTEVGLTKCQYPLTAEYGKYTVTYTDGTSATSYSKLLTKYIVKDGFALTNYDYSLLEGAPVTQHDGYINLDFHTVYDGYYVEKTDCLIYLSYLDLVNYDKLYFDLSYQISGDTGKEIRFMFFANAPSNDSVDVLNKGLLYKLLYYGELDGGLINVNRSLYSIDFNASNYGGLNDPVFDINNFVNSNLGLYISYNSEHSDVANINANIYNIYLPLAE